MSNFLAKAFGFDSAKHSVRTEIVAGITRSSRGRHLAGLFTNPAY